jgi:hypothetical protein
MGNPPITKWTEYWFNDSIIVPGNANTPESGVSNRKIRLIKHPQWVVWAMDALDEFPRHEGKGNNGTTRAGKDNLLFGDQSVKLLSYSEYQDSDDPMGAPAPFFNWGHYYPP